MDCAPIHVLLIEDNEEHVQLLSRLLLSAEGPEFQLSVAATVTDGLDRFEKHGADLVLLDLTLPDSDGMETFLRVIERVNSAPVVVLSGISDLSLALEMVQMGAQDYLVKSHVDKYLLVRSLQYAMERKRVQLELKRAKDELEKRVQERTTALRQINSQLEREIAERRRAEAAALESSRQLTVALEQLQAAHQENIQRERMLALGRMANGIAHDFNNALTPIVGFSELLLINGEVLGDASKARTYLEMIHTSAKDSAKVVSRLRDFYRYRDHTETLAPVVINDLILQVIAVTQPRWKDQALAAGVNIEIRTELGKVPCVPGNEEELKEMLVNLLFNAIDAIPKRGTITISSHVEGAWLVLTVSDTGVGMSEEVRARCLEPFFTTKDDESAGLGLGSVYGVVRRHEGRIDIQSELGRGTSVSVSLPIQRGEQAPEAAATTPSAGQPLRVLVVEDEPLVREVLTIYLSEDQHEIVTAENGREGLARFQTGRFDLVLTDRAMPDMNGDELAVEVKKLKPDQKVILLTGFGDLLSGSGEQLPGVDLVVSKPFTLDKLRTAIAQVLGR